LADFRGKIEGIEGLVEFGIERALGGPGEFVGGDPDLLLRRFVLRMKHGEKITQSTT
jgi:hypothetical protein